MAQPTASVVKSLFVTLKRGFAGTPQAHRNVLTALGLTKIHQCLEKPNNQSIRGMLMKVPHMVIIQTDRMFYLRSMKEHYERLPRPPLHLVHGQPPTLSLAAAATDTTTSSESSPAGASPLSAPLVAMARPLALPSPAASTSDAGGTAMAGAAGLEVDAADRALRSGTTPATTEAAAAAAEPVQAPAAPRRTRFEHGLLTEHVYATGMDGYKTHRTLRKPVRKLFAEARQRRRVLALNNFGLYSPQVRRLNRQDTNPRPFAVRVGSRSA